MTYTSHQICKILDAVPSASDHEIAILLTDSRSLTDPLRSAFFAISTPTNDGHRFIPSLYEKGVRTFIVVHKPDDAYRTMPDAEFIQVDDVRVALQKLAGQHRRQFAIPVIGITGSKGKTTVKEWLYQVLCGSGNVLRSPRSFNSQLGVPLSLWEINDSTDISIIEAGVSRSGEMEVLKKIINPTIGIITGIDSEHSEGFRSMEQKCKEKCALFSESDCIIYCRDNALITRTVSDICPDAKHIGWSVKDSSAPLFVTDIETHGDFTTFSYRYAGCTGHIHIPFNDQGSISNSIHVLGTLLSLGVDPDIISEGLKHLAPVVTRMDVLEGVNGCMIIRDGYTSDLHSLIPALDFMSRRRTSKHSTTLILSDVMHETLSAQEVYRRVAHIIKKREIGRLIGIGPQFMAFSNMFGDKLEAYPDTTAFLSSVTAGDFHDELVLVKGAPSFHFETIVNMLEARQHETLLEVNLDSVVHNYNFFRSQLRPSTGIVCMVKASGYGAGSYELAKTLQSQGAAYLAVAVADEGVGLRQAGITMPIMVLNPRVDNYRSIFAYHLEPEIFSMNLLKSFIREGEKCGVENYPVHIKIDSGMHRLGFLEKDIPELLDVLKNQHIVRPMSVFSHLAVADEPLQDAYTYEQFDRFIRCADLLQGGFKYHILRHILNSTGITRFPEYQMDMVRLGICLYGIPTLDDGSQASLKQVSSLTTTIISLKRWVAGTTIGYGRRGLLKRDSVIATIPIGYADGLNRHLGNGNLKVFIDGHRCPTVGNICMDACMIDVTGVDCAVGTKVEIFGPNIPVSELSDALDTIPYEILTSVSSRVKRIYYRE